MNDRKRFGCQKILVKFNIRYLILKKTEYPSWVVLKRKVLETFAPGPPSKGLQLQKWKKINHNFFLKMPKFFVGALPLYFNDIVKKIY